MLHGTAYVNAITTCVCSYLSLTGSVLIILSYTIARTKSTPKSSFLILHLATSDFFWFLMSTTISTLWLSQDGYVPDALCYIASPLINFTRMASLIWTVVISYNVYMSVKKRKWFWKSQEKDWENYRKKYFLIIFVLALPSAILNIVKQHETSEHSSLGCSPQYEPIGVWYEVFFTELLPIVLGFFLNIYVFLKVRHRMTKTAFPLSVRKRRKRVMYHYIVVCILCWIPTILLYILELAGNHLPALEVFARASLYTSGFLNFLCFGLQDPHLKRSFEVMVTYFGLETCLETLGCLGYSALKSSDVEKVVMFREETIVKNADKPKDRMSIYRNRKLSKEDKFKLYMERPDLNPKYRHVSALPKPSSSSKRGENSPDEVHIESPNLSQNNSPNNSPSKPRPQSPGPGPRPSQTIIDQDTNDLPRRVTTNEETISTNSNEDLEAANPLHLPKSQQLVTSSRQQSRNSADSDNISLQNLSKIVENVFFPSVDPNIQDQTPLMSSLLNNSEDFDNSFEERNSGTSSHDDDGSSSSEDEIDEEDLDLHAPLTNE